jgi:hypothetical protein
MGERPNREGRRRRSKKGKLHLELHTVILLYLNTPKIKIKN